MAYILLVYSFLVISCKQEDKLFFTYLHTNPDKPLISQDSIMKLQEAHIKNITRLSEEGIIKAAGPFENGGGIFIMKVGSGKELDHILNSDPAIKAKRFKLESHPVEFIYGQLFPVDTIYTMVFYDFYQTSPLHSDINLEELTTGKDSLSLISHLKFKDTGQNLLLIKNSSKITKSDSILKDIISPSKVEQRKVLWIAKETFEK